MSHATKKNTIMLIVIGVLLLFFLIIGTNTVHEASEKAYRHTCANNLRLISQALINYANDNNGYYPNKNTVYLLTSKGYIDPSLFICPVRRKITGLSIIADSDYAFFTEGKKCNDISNDDILVMDKEKNHGDGGSINVMHANDTYPREEIRTNFPKSLNN